MTIGQRITELRENRNLELETVSEKSNIPLKKLKKIENDLYIPTREEVQALSSVFEIEEKEIVNEETRQSTLKIEAKISLNNLVYWIMNLVVYLFFIIVAFIPALNVKGENEEIITYSLNSLMMAKGNAIVLVAYIFSVLGFVISLEMIVGRYNSKVKLTEKVINIINMILLAILILVIVTIFVVVFTYSNDFVSLII